MEYIKTTKIVIQNHSSHKNFSNNILNNQFIDFMLKVEERTSFFITEQALLK